jgi:hypothetical protein
MANVKYNYGKGEFAKGNIDWANDTIKVALVTSSYTPDADGDENFDDITNEVSGTGYTAGGNALANTSVTVDNTNDLAKLDADNEVWSDSTITARGAVVYKDSGASSTSPLICYLDFTEDKASTGGSFTVNFNADGVLTLS